MPAATNNNEEKDKNPFVKFINNVAPAAFVTIVTAAIFWVANNTTSANTQLAVLTTQLNNLQTSVDNLKKDITSSESSKYTGAQANSDKALVQSELLHLKEDFLDLKTRVSVLEKQNPK